MTSSVVAARWMAVVLSVAPVIPALAVEPVFPGLMGLVEIPALFDSGAPRAPSAAMALRDEPSPDAPVVAWASDAQSLEHYEWSYEAPAAAVYGYLHDGRTVWLRVHLVPSASLKWIAASDAGTFHPLSGILDDSLAYLTQAWDGRVHARAGDAASATSLGVRGDEVPVAVAASARVKDRMWYLVTVLGESPCSSADAPSVVGAGWVPEHAASGMPTLWFYARGC